VKRAVWRARVRASEAEARELLALVARLGGEVWRDQEGEGEPRGLNARFTALADRVSEAMGDWRTTACSVLVVLAWLALGPGLGWSDTWQLMINTPTTVAELWIGFLLAAAANRNERRLRRLLAQLARDEQAVLAEARGLEGYAAHTDRLVARLLTEMARLRAEQPPNRRGEEERDDGDMA
jgi:low affinity Fe/Cu permease